jgi:hypothetical protein
MAYGNQESVAFILKLDLHFCRRFISVFFLINLYVVQQKALIDNTPFSQSVKDLVSLNKWRH